MEGNPSKNTAMMERLGENRLRLELQDEIIDLEYKRMFIGI